MLENSVFLNSPILMLPKYFDTKSTIGNAYLERKHTHAHFKYVFKNEFVDVKEFAS